MDVVSSHTEGRGPVRREAAFDLHGLVGHFMQRRVRFGDTNPDDVWWIRHLDHSVPLIPISNDLNQ